MLCLDRYQAENIIRAARVENDAASLGTTVHGALERYVKYIKFEKPGHQDDWDLLLMFYHVSYAEVFGTVETKDAKYKDGLAMLKGWFERTNIQEIEVVSCEKKTSFPVKTSVGVIPFNYIWDRFDKIGEDEYKVVDYKSSKFNVTPDGLRDKLQARCYALAAQIEYPNAKRIWVEFDMLRHERVSIVFTREDNIETWKEIKRLAELIITTDEPKPTLNDECLFCVKRIKCQAANSNVNVGGLISLDYMEDAELADFRAQIDFQMKALKKNLADVDTHLLSRARAQDELSIPGETAYANVAVYQRREVDPDRVRLVVGEDKFLQYGGVTLTIGSFDQMMKDDSIPAETKAKLKGLVYKSTGEPKIQTKRKSNFHE